MARLQLHEHATQVPLMSVQVQKRRKGAGALNQILLRVLHGCGLQQDNQGRPELLWSRLEKHNEHQRRIRNEFG